MGVSACNRILMTLFSGWPGSLDENIWMLLCISKPDFLRLHCFRLFFQKDPKIHQPWFLFLWSSIMRYCLLFVFWIYPCKFPILTCVIFVNAYLSQFMVLKFILSHSILIGMKLYFNATLQTSYSYLDVVGRKTLVLVKENVVPEHNVPFEVFPLARFGMIFCKFNYIWRFFNLLKHIITSSNLSSMEFFQYDYRFCLEQLHNFFCFKILTHFFDPFFFGIVFKFLQIYYKFNPIFMLAEPLMLVSAFFLFFIACIAYLHTDLSISKWWMQVMYTICIWLCQILHTWGNFSSFTDFTVLSRWM